MMKAERHEKADLFLKITNEGTPLPLVFRFQVKTEKDFEDFIKEVKPFILPESCKAQSACF